ncbi:integrase core domain-containing protein [Thauera aromatica]|uniref:integrase core domain-containing protein n=1 Tax=Thauera aromatica TaxID=59405 RepID=UPI003D7C3677
MKYPICKHGETKPGQTARQARDSGADARARCQTFFAWYNTEHRHSGIGYMTPSSVHYDHAQAARALRQNTLDAAFLANPKRFKGRCPAPPVLPTAVWINPPAKEKPTTRTPRLPQ